MKVGIPIDPNQEVFTHQSPDDGKLRTFLVGTMRTVAERYGPACRGISCETVAIEPDHVAHIRDKCGIEQDRIDRLVAPYLDEPCMGIKWPDGTFTLVDGNHRMVKLHELGKTNFKCFIFEYPFWERFLWNLPDAEQRLTMPSGVIENERRRTSA